MSGRKERMKSKDTSRVVHENFTLLSCRRKEMENIILSGYAENDGL